MEEEQKGVREMGDVEKEGHVASGRKRQRDRDMTGEREEDKDDGRTVTCSIDEKEMESDLRRRIRREKIGRTSGRKRREMLARGDKAMGR